MQVDLFEFKVNELRVMGKRGRVGRACSPTLALARTHHRITDNAGTGRAFAHLMPAFVLFVKKRGFYALVKIRSPPGGMICSSELPNETVSGADPA